jgi:hypothetical protein
MAVQVIGHTADDIVHRTPQVAAAVAVEIHRVLAVAARHELAQAHGAGVGTHHFGSGTPSSLPSRMKFISSLREKIRAVIAGVRVVEGQRGQRVEHAVAAGDAAVVGLHADDGDDVLRIDLELAEASRTSSRARARTARRPRSAPA